MTSDETGTTRSTFQHHTLSRRTMSLSCTLTRSPQTSAGLVSSPPSCVLSRGPTRGGAHHQRSFTVPSWKRSCVVAQGGQPRAQRGRAHSRQGQDYVWWVSTRHEKKQSNISFEKKQFLSRLQVRFAVKISVLQFAAHCCTRPRRDLVSSFQPVSRSTVTLVLRPGCIERSVNKAGE